MEIWINPACSKCRTATAALDEAGITYTTRRYLDEPPSIADLKTVLERLGLQPWDIVRMNEQIAKDLGLKSLPRDSAHHQDWLTAMASHPKLIQRPIITLDDSTAVIARDDHTLKNIIAQGG